MTGMPPSVSIRRLPELVAGFATDAPDIAVSDLTLDSRQVRPGTLFLACRGTRQHGLDFLPQALAAGASALLWEPTQGVAAPRTSIPVLAVEGLSRRVLGSHAGRRRERDVHVGHRRGGGEDEDDQEHKRQVEQRRDIQLAQRVVLVRGVFFHRR